MLSPELQLARNIVFPDRRKDFNRDGILAGGCPVRRIAGDAPASAGTHLVRFIADREIDPAGHEVARLFMRMAVLGQHGPSIQPDFTQMKV
jgi:hypothetical protein